MIDATFTFSDILRDVAMETNFGKSLADLYLSHLHFETDWNIGKLWISGFIVLMMDQHRVKIW